jgi:hypothetical protein
MAELRYGEEKTTADGHHLMSPVRKSALSDPDDVPLKKLKTPELSFGRSSDEQVPPQLEPNYRVIWVPLDNVCVGSDGISRKFIVAVYIPPPPILPPRPEIPVPSRMLGPPSVGCFGYCP